MGRVTHQPHRPPIGGGHERTGEGGEHMLTDLLQNLKKALDSKDKKATEKAYKQLEKVGVDRNTARLMTADL